MKFDVIVVGAGLSGSVAARYFAEKGKTVLLIEKRNHVAGNCYDYKNDSNISIHKYGPHIFHTKYKHVWDYVNRFAHFHNYQHRVLSYTDGKYFPFPINLDTINMAFGLNLSAGEIQDFLHAEATNSGLTPPPNNFREAVISQIGETLYQMFFEGYTKKQWEREPDQLKPELAKRIPVRYNRDDRYFSDRYQGIPVEGYTGLTLNILNHDKISLLLKCDYFTVRDQLSADIIVYTGELDTFFDNSFGELEYRSVRFEFRNLEREKYQPAAVVNYPNDYDWTRITEFKYFTGDASPKTTICLEFPLSAGDPYYIVPTEENAQKRKKYMEKVRELEDKGKYIFIGRLAEYRYFNMDEVILNTLTRLDEKY